MSKNKRMIGKVAVALGGFIIVIGIILLGAFSLAFFGVFDPALFISEESRVLLVYVLLILGIVDLISGVILIIA